MFILVSSIVLAGCVDMPGSQEAPSQDTPFADDADIGATRIFAPIREAGFPEGIVVDGERVYVGFSPDTGSDPVVLAYALASGELIERVPVVRAAPRPDEPITGTRPIVGLAADAAGRLYVLDANDGAILRIDPSQDPPSQSTYATLPDLPPCPGALAVAPCAPTLQDRPPIPNMIAFDAAGNAYVSDFYQATIFRVPPGGGEPTIWYQDERFGVVGPNGIAIGPGEQHLYIAHTELGRNFGLPSGPVPEDGSGEGAVYRLPLVERPTVDELEVVHRYDTRVDGLGFGVSGRLYVTMVGPARTGLSILEPDGTEAVSVPPSSETSGPITWQTPTNLAFHDAHRSILVVNAAEPEDQALLEVFVDDVGLLLHRPDVP